MNATVISFISAKGGSGKTITAATLAGFLSFFGKTVLIIDCDAATNGLTLFFLDEIMEKKSKSRPNGQPAAKTDQPLLGLFESANLEKANASENLSEGCELSEQSLPVHTRTSQNFFVIPSSFVQMRTQDVHVPRFENILKWTISMYKKDFDYIFLDAQAGADEFAEVAIRNSDENIIVSEYDPVSIQGVERLKNLFSNSLDPNRTWVLYNKLLPEVAEKFSEFLTITRILSPIPWDAEVVRAFAKQELPLNMEEGSTHTFAIMRTARMLFRKNVIADIKKWLEETESKIKEPSKKLLDNYENELVELRDMQKDLNVKMRTAVFITDLMGPLAMGLILMVIGSLSLFIAIDGVKFLGVESFVELILIFLEQPTVVAIFVGVSLALGIILVALRSIFTTKKVIREESQKAELAVIRDKIVELSEERKKVKSFLQSDIEKIAR